MVPTFVTIFSKTGFFKVLLHLCGVSTYAEFEEVIQIFCHERIKALQNSLQSKSIDLLLKIVVNCLSLLKENLEFELKSKFEVRELDISKLKQYRVTLDIS